MLFSFTVYTCIHNTSALHHYITVPAVVKKKRRIQLLSFRHFIRPSRYPQARCGCYTSRYRSRSSHPPNTDASGCSSIKSLRSVYPGGAQLPEFQGLHFGSLYIWSTASRERLDDSYRNRKTMTGAKRLHAG